MEVQIDARGRMGCGKLIAYLPRRDVLRRSVATAAREMMKENNLALRGKDKRRTR